MPPTRRQTRRQTGGGRTTGRKQHSHTSRGVLRPQAYNFTAEVSGHLRHDRGQKRGEQLYSQAVKAADANLFKNFTNKVHKQEEEGQAYPYSYLHVVSDTIGKIDKLVGQHTYGMDGLKAVREVNDIFSLHVTNNVYETLTAERGRIIFDDTTPTILAKFGILNDEKEDMLTHLTFLTTEDNINAPREYITELGQYIDLLIEANTELDGSSVEMDMFATTLAETIQRAIVESKAVYSKEPAPFRNAGADLNLNNLTSMFGTMKH